MSFSAEIQGSDGFYNNADSFAMAFDDIWKSYSSKQNQPIANKEDKINSILHELKDHPFLKSHPEKAKEIAIFRLRLLKLE